MYLHNLTKQEFSAYCNKYYWERQREIREKYIKIILIEKIGVRQFLEAFPLCPLMSWSWETSLHLCHA